MSAGFSDTTARSDVGGNSAGGFLNTRWGILCLSTILVLAILAIYYPVYHYPFLINIDDGGYVYENFHILHQLDWGETKWAFTHSYCLNYDPLTFLAHSLDVRMFQLNAGRHHEVNVFFHILDALLLFWLLRRSTGSIGRSFMVAALFAVHPLNVENVAWISELKTLLSTAFFLLSLGAYAWYVRRPLLWRMVVVGFFYGFGLLAKPQIITLPFVLLLWDYWPLRRLVGGAQRTWLDGFGSRAVPRRPVLALICEKIPLFIITLVDILLTLRAEHKPFLERYTFLIRFGTAVRSYVVYLWKAVWPVHLALNYPHPGYSLRWDEVWAAAAFLCVITAVVIANRRYGYLLVGWFWFLGTMLPTINLVQIDVAAVADRYAYISFVGLFLIACWGLADLAQQRQLPKTTLALIAAVVLLTFTTLSRLQVRYWSDAVTVWTHTLQVTGDNWRVDWELGMIYVKTGEVDKGLKYIYKAQTEKPLNPSIALDIATTEHQRRNLSQAILYYEKTLAISRDKVINAQILANMGHAYGDMGDEVRALECYRRAQALNIQSHLAP
jgi:protein O-mannosyl-transferase